LSARPEAQVRLRVADAGRTQTLDVRTGTRAADAIPGYYRPTTRELDLDRRLPAGIIVRGVPYPLLLKVTEPILILCKAYAVLAPWTPQQGWASPGHAWLVLPSPVLDEQSPSQAPLVRLTVNEPAVFHVRLPDGTLIPEVGGRRTMASSDGMLDRNPADLVFTVPAGFTSGTYLVDLSRAPVTAVFSDGDLPAHWRPAPPVIAIPLTLGS
jgi:hypothetical protein